MPKNKTHSESSLLKQNFGFQPTLWQALHLQKGNSIFLVPQPSALKTSYIPLFLSLSITVFKIHLRSNKFSLSRLPPQWSKPHLPLASTPLPYRLFSTQSPVTAARAKVGSERCNQLAERQNQNPTAHLIQLRGSFWRLGGRTRSLGPAGGAEWSALALKVWERCNWVLHTDLPGSCMQYRPCVNP